MTPLKSSWLYIFTKWLTYIQVKFDWRKLTMSQYIIGIDVGGTNTDVVLTHDGQILSTAKTETTTDVTTGITTAIKIALESSGRLPGKVQRVMIGTTHLLNATLQNRLSKVAIIRLGYPATTAIPPCTGWPKELEDTVNAASYIIEGGYEYNGTPIAYLNSEALKAIAQELKDKNINLVAISGVFAHVNATQEIEAAAILKKFNPDLNISLSHHMGGLGLLERENATILNSALLPIYRAVSDGIQQTLHEIGLENASIFLSHNDGTLEPIGLFTEDHEHQQKPILTLNAGPTNSMRGAARLAKALNKHNLIVADVGGTSTDVGVIRNDAPIEENAQFTIAGVPLNLPNIRTQSIGLGGGSIIKHNHGANISIGPESVSNRLMQEAINFGGNMLTATDIAIFKNRLKLTKDKIACPYSEEQIEQIDNMLHDKFARIITEVWSSSQDKPDTLMLVGGGSYLFDRNKLLRLLTGKINEIIIPDNATVANALGAAEGEICGIHREVFDYQNISREEAHKQVVAAATAKAIKGGAETESIKIKFKSEEEIQYVTGTPTVITMKVSGKVREHIVKIPTSKEIFTSESETRLQSVNHWNNSSVSSGTPITTKVSNSITSAKISAGNEINLADRAIGHAVLGSGGGGDTRLAALMVKDCIKNGKPIKIIPLDSLSDDATVICFGIMGSPSVLEEKLPSKEEIVKSIFEMEKELGKKITAIMPMEAGGANGLLPLIAAAELGIPIVDADCMGRAFPGINMVTPAIYNKTNQSIAVLANSTTVKVIEAENASQLEDKARAATDNMGGLVFIAYMPMTGNIAKEVCIPQTLSIAEKIGARFNESHTGGSILDNLNYYLKDTEYKKIQQLFSGRIEDLVRKEQHGFSVGGAIINNDAGEQVEVIFQNENLLLRKKLSSDFYQDLAIAPTLIVIVDHETMRPISCGQLKYGQSVLVLTLDAPKKMLQPEAINVVGSQAYNLDKLVRVLHPDSMANKVGYFANNASQVIF